ncbi:hypothetical protein OCO_45720 [Mycobacterium intracellulare MOTT-02]|uniref:Uncharacterized protein n=2 Tax=Mycobacterium intracellulare TaxID=1767 RepID=H8IU99_MYCIA|nr:hypothetical protein OCU_45430 [Mycobacterium intracellulare ATCC 13950]AFC50935.1 hypothetical protein OCO_45720 [Mycobacterium intracellulare MOTT-02]AFC56189.1 hypothetical protein OCQ_46770 [Mycobacterium paraintracellulare]AFS16660.1 Hypothetical protein MIP_06926 [Mycobacterium intracellulare subsp. intracellulare MTCC 9506]AGP66121.1 hypothetical protein OEM_45860 [Mycobacterium intracellulare subsp. yongonense 05-1390]ETZ26679.1 hypothetical protein L842_4864 [Mycobacterium intracel
MCHHFIIYVPGDWCDDTGCRAPQTPLHARPAPQTDLSTP